MIAIIGIITLSFSFGFVAGSWFKATIYDSQPWEVFRWDAGALGYRPVPMGAMLWRNDNVLMGLRMNSEQFPAEGIRVEGGE